MIPDWKLDRLRDALRARPNRRNLTKLIRAMKSANQFCVPERDDILVARVIARGPQRGGRRVEALD